MRSFIFLLVSFLVNLSISAQSVNIDGINYTFSGASTLSVTTGSYTGDIIIPSTVIYEGNGQSYTVTAIGENAFYKCTGLTSVSIPNSVTRIEDYAFFGCTNLSTITVQGSISSIGYRVFEGTEWQNSATPENGIKYLGNLAIAYDGTTKDITFKENTTCISAGLFSKTGGVTLGNVILPIGINNIPKGMFFQCTIDKLVIPENVERIAYNAFYTSIGYTKIRDLVIDDSENPLVIESSYDAKSSSFRKTTITSLCLGRPMTIAQITGVEQDYSHPFGEATISKATITHDFDVSGLFYNCKVSEVEFPEDMSTIGDYAFYGSNYLVKVISKSTTPPIVSSTAFTNSSYKYASLFVPYGYLDSYTSSNYWSEFKNISYYDVDIVSMSANKICTYSSTYDLDFTDITGVKAYIISGFSPSTCTLTLTPVTTVRAGVGLLLKGNEGEYIVPHTSTDMYYSNLLVGVPTTTYVTPTDGAYTNFILSNGSHGINFYTLSEAGNITGGKAYLQLPTSALPSNASGFIMDFDTNDGETTGIKGTAVTSNTEYYDLQGRKVEHPSMGVYIVNGKKVIIK